ncbi:MAG: M28 family peptidase [Bacteroidales bacterium]|nr:M28 family peptidase [Bacteroidales bacterium]
MKRILKIVLPALLISLSLPGQDDRAGVLRAEVAFLADSLQTGRACGTAGAQSVTFYLLRELRNAGLRTTVQSFPAGEKAGHNVVAVTPGWFRSYLVVSAYFDGLGTLDGTLYPGADANASGVAALLALARTLPADCTGDTGLIFVAFDGHHTDLSGAKAFLDRFRGKYPLAGVINLDQIGSTLAPVHSGRPDYLIALGGNAFRAGLEAANRLPRLDLSFDYYGSASFTELFYRRIGDQRWFLEAGIPAVMFTSGITMNTNKPADTAATLDYAVLSRRLTLIETWLRSRL